MVRQPSSARRVLLDVAAGTAITGPFDRGDSTKHHRSFTTKNVKYAVRPRMYIASAIQADVVRVRIVGAWPAVEPAVGRSRIRRVRWTALLACLGATVLSGRMLVQAGNRPNVLLITVDTLRADRVGGLRLCARAHAGARSPRVAVGVRFADATAHAPLTYPSHVAILTGPLSGGVRHPRQRYGNVACRRAVTLAEQLQGGGLRDWRGRRERRARRGAYGLSQGFADYDDRIPVPARATLSTAESAAARPIRSRLAARKWLAGRTEPWFLWVHYYDPHLPYDRARQSLPRSPRDGPTTGRSPSPTPSSARCSRQWIAAEPPWS